MVGTVLVAAALLVFSCSGCSPIYVAQAGWTELKILTGRRPLEEVIQDPATDDDTRSKLRLTQQAHAFAVHMLELDAGDSYTTFTQLDREVLAWIVSAAYKDRLASKTWWFPVVGRVPYRGYGSRESAERAEADLQEEGFDTYLRPTSAFSTLGWFSDPLLSTLLRYDEIELVETVLHELSHNHLWVPGNVRFNESYATFVGRVGAIRFFCGLQEGVSPTEECRAATARWEDYLEFSGFLDQFVSDLEAIYARTDLTSDEKVQARGELFSRYQTERGVEPEGGTAEGLVETFLTRPLNNAILLSRMRYFHRLGSFQALLDAHFGDLTAAITTLERTVGDFEDPFQALPDSR